METAVMPEVNRERNAKSNCILFEIARLVAEYQPKGQRI